MLERVWRKVSSPTLGGNVNWVQPLWRKHEGFLKKLKTELPYDPAIPLLSIYPEKTTIWKDTCMPIFSSIYNSQDMEATETSNRGMDKEDVVYIYNGTLLSHIKEWNNTICCNMDGHRWIDTEWRKGQRTSLCIMNLYIKRKQSYRCRKQTYGYQRVKRV